MIYPGEHEVKELEFESAQPDMIFFPKIDSLKEKVKLENGLNLNWVQETVKFLLYKHK